MEKYKSFFMPGAILGAGALIAVSVWGTGGLQISVPEEGLEANVAEGGGIEAPPVSEGDYIRGNPSAPVTVVEYSDLECPFCRQFHPTMVQVLVEYGDQVRWVYKHFPLDQIHPQARPAAEASECVGEQKGSEGFWQFADAMFEQQERLGAAFYREVAEQIGVDLAQFDECVNTRKFADKVEAQLQEGIQFGVNGTPGSFVNSTPVRGALPYANLKAIVDQELQKL